MHSLTRIPSLFSLYFQGRKTTHVSTLSTHSSSAHSSSEVSAQGFVKHPHDTFFDSAMFDRPGANPAVNGLVFGRTSAVRSHHDRIEHILDPACLAEDTEMAEI
jgi:hypothetical protein